MFLTGFTVLLGCTLSLLLPAYVQSGPARGLIYSATADYRHDSIPTARDALTAQGQSINVQYDATEDNSRFTDAGLAPYDVLIFLMNTGEVLDATGKAALQRYLDLGGNFVAIHSASDCLRNTTFYGREVGAFFDSHPVLQNAVQFQIRSQVARRRCGPFSQRVFLLGPWPPSVRSGDTTPNRCTETVFFSSDVSMLKLYIRAWYQEHGAGSENGTTAGRSFYTSLGHLNETWQDNIFLGHVGGGISWALKSNTTRAFNSSGQVGNGKSRHLRQIPDPAQLSFPAIGPLGLRQMS